MKTPPKSDNESQRLQELTELDILDSLPEERYDRICRVAQSIFHVPITLITMVDANRQWFKACLGFHDGETSRDVSFCGHAILQDDVMIVPDAWLDDRFSDNPLVLGEPFIRFYAGAPIRGPRGYKVGTLCVIDRQPREMTTQEIQTLKDLGAWVELELRSIEQARYEKEHEQAR